MKPIECAVEIAAPSGTVWRVVTDIENAAKHISAITSIEMLDGPRSGKGMRWRETRMMYVATATNHGTFYRSEVRVEPSGAGSRLAFTFEAQALTLFARMMSALMMPLMKGAVVKALNADLEALKAHCERIAKDEREEHDR